MKRLHIWLLLAAMLSISGTQGALAAAEAITIALGSEPTTLDPQLREDGGERAVNDNIYDTVLTRDPQGELIPSLAAEMPKLSYSIAPASVSFATSCQPAPSCSKT